jgi:CheY-like chemotaxis protein
MEGHQAPFRPTILYVDDDRLLVKLCCDVLESHGYRTLIATDGVTGFETAREARPDLILLDVMMPGMDGLEVCRRLRADPLLRRIPIILLTSLQDLGLDVKGLKAGANRVLRKQFSSLEIVTAIQEILAEKTSSKTE